ncbi:MAG: hypothetical protein IPK81_11635 [Rhodospirillales bacterium]|nr:MAG: hypothetical protein IPK81_11635 [Rhodospirillales bacterium]
MSAKRYAFWYALLFAVAFTPAALSIWSGGFRIFPIVVASIVAAVIPVVLIWLARRLGFPVAEAVACARCGAAQPMFRVPADAGRSAARRLRLRGCGAKLDARGREIAGGR